jgi:excinuclease ABC subunit C
MRGEKGEVLYVGKAKDLRNRVRSYFSGGDTRFNAIFLVRKVTEIETVITQDERQALILENDLIKKYRPRYNLRLKDDKAHLLVRIDESHDWPRLELVRRERNDSARYIGPFAFAYELKTLLEIIRNSLPLRTCSDRVIFNRIRPCLEYQLKRCSGPCCLPVDRSDYQGWLEAAIDILEGRSAAVVERLSAQMERASESLRFEEAARLRDQISVLTKATAERPVYAFSAGSKDALGIYRDGSRFEISVMQVRRGRLRNAKTFGFEEVDLPEEELLGAFMTQYYGGDGEIPEQILLPIRLEDFEAREELYGERRGGKVRIEVPERGDKARLISLALENARENYFARFGLGKADLPLRTLRDELGLTQIPRTIECIDISHFQGGSTVASVVHFRDGRPERGRYRTFVLESQEGKPDDFASMREVVTRHLSRCVEEGTTPDLIVIDGGKAQLAMAIAARGELSEPQLIALAKKRGRKLPYFAKLSGVSDDRVIYKPERVYVEGKTAPIVLRQNSKALHLLEQLRDEAHRFALSFHRERRAQNFFRSPLEDVRGLGPKRRKELLRVFGGLQGIRNATAAEIVERAGVPERIAARVLERLKN